MLNDNVIINTDVCENEFCLHNSIYEYGDISEWNKTNCIMFEIDPYDEKENPTGFNVRKCDARIRYLKMGWT